MISELRLVCDHGPYDALCLLDYLLLLVLLGKGLVFWGWILPCLTCVPINSLSYSENCLTGD